MRLCLINLYKHRPDHLGAIQSLSCMRLAAIAAKENSDAFIRLLSFSKDSSNKNIVNEILRLNPTDVGFTVQVWSEEKTRSISNYLFREGYEGRLIFGGPQVPYIKHYLYPKDAIFVFGEGEEFISKLSKGEKHRASECIIDQKNIFESHNKKDLICGLPLYTKLFLSAIGGYEKIHKKVMLWETSRGCHYKCGFCGHKQREIVSYFPWNIVEAEFFGIMSISPGTLFIVDPIMGGNPSRLIKILKLFCKFAPNIKLAGYIRTEFLTHDLINYLSSSNIIEILVGIQSLNQNIPKWIRSNNRKAINDKLPMLSFNKIPWRAELIIGLPGDNFYELKRTFNFVIECLRPKQIRAYPLLVIPGTKLSKTINAYDRSCWVRISKNNRAIETNSYSEKEMERMKEYSGALSSIYNYFTIVDSPCYSFEKLDSIILSQLSKCTRSELKKFQEQDKEWIFEYWRTHI